METFMPDIAFVLNNRTDKTGAARGADGTSVQEVITPAHATGPYHIVNTNVLLVNSQNKTYSDRSD